MSRTVTVGFDGSPESLAARDWAAREAVCRAVPLRLLRIRSEDDDPRTRRWDPATARGWGERALDTAERRLIRRHPGLATETQWTGGDPVEELCAAADEAELLVLGSRGLGGLAGFFAGSVSLAVLARTRRPVVLVRPHDPPAAAEDAPAGEVVVGLDVSAPGDEVLAFGFAAADRYGCVLRVLHTWAAPALYGAELGAVQQLISAEVAQDARRALDAALSPWTDTYPGVAVVRECRQGRPAQDLVEAARRARLVVVGRRNRRARLGTHIGAVTHAVVHHCPAPVAVVPHD
ncbi:universal stress protein [Streptomyces bambusae]|uniref:universal stress protein n=1 Tax=Streptomyces bambusae TaxID=1550616 RepID=UPI001CFF592E|nr:universal stress protein [Streptomyces bambusae]MCB5169442.1 universal stress protein [Streptomyces bambusae]